MTEIKIDNADPQTHSQEQDKPDSRPTFIDEVDALEKRVAKSKKLGGIMAGIAFACCSVAVCAALMTGYIGPDSTITKIDVPKVLLQYLDGDQSTPAFQRIESRSGNSEEASNPLENQTYIGNPFESVTVAFGKVATFVGPALGILVLAMAVLMGRFTLIPAALALMAVPTIMNIFMGTSSSLPTNTVRLEESSKTRREIFNTAVEHLDYAKVREVITGNNHPLASQYLMAQVSVAIALKDGPSTNTGTDIPHNKARARDDVAKLFAFDDGRFTGFESSDQALYALDAYGNGEPTVQPSKVYKTERMEAVSTADNVRSITSSTAWVLALISIMIFSFSAFLGARVRRIKELLHRAFDPKSWIPMK
ncbi:hypothetical protein ACK3BE_32455 (plasmid) [Pseudomonas mandelii]|uniref:hypothetical protein n=1 Tax=Pseudomonas mandelii TaxID=75612 RepID=UPI00398D2DF1